MGITVCISSIRATTLGDTIAAIQRQEYTEWELIVVVQGPNPEPRQVVKKAAANDLRIRCLHLTEFGASRSRNAGIAAAQYDIVAITDDDCAPAPDWLTVIEGYFSREPELGLLAGSLVAPHAERSGISECPATIVPELVFDPDTMQKCPPHFSIAGANMAVRKSMWQRVGPFDEAIGPGAAIPSSEEIEYIIRLENNRVKMRCTPRSIVVHTFGRRYGLKAVLALGRSYALGQGGIAGKQTLLGSPDGASWRDTMRRQCLTEPMRALRVQRLPKGILRWLAFREGYDLCLKRFTVDERGLLQEKISTKGL